MKSLIISAGLVFFSLNVMAQLEEINGGPVNVPAEGIVDGVYIQEHIPTKRMIPYEYVREADVIWSRRVWEYIDLREKINLPLYYPLDEITSSGEWVRNGSRWSLWTVLRYHVMNGNLRLFSPYNPLSFGFGLGGKDGDQLKYPIDPSQPGLNFYTDSLYREELSIYLGTLGAQSDIPLTDENGDQIVITLPDGTQSFTYSPRDTIWYTSQDIVQYRIKEDSVYDAFYKLENAREQITAYVLDLVRAEVPTMSLDEVFERKDSIANAVKNELTGTMQEFGYEIVKALVTNIDPDEKVKNAMNEINEQQRLQVAAQAKGEAEKILKVKQAEAEAESKRLQGEGIANQRKAIIAGLQESVNEFQRAIPGVTAADTMSLALITQYFDTLKEIGAHSKSNTILLPHSPGGLKDIATQLRDNIITGNLATSSE